MKHSSNLSHGTEKTSFPDRVKVFFKVLMFKVRIPWWKLIVFIRKIKNWFYDRAQFNELWSDIKEMPIYNWISILETGDLGFIFKTKGILGYKASEHWLGLQQEYIDEFGLDESYKQQLRLMDKLHRLNINFCLTRDRSLLNLIKITEIDLNQSNNEKIITFHEILDHAEKYKGFAIDPKKISVSRWYSTLKNMSNGNTGE